MASASRGPGPDDLDALFTKTTKQLRNAAKACRIGKGGVACAVLDVAAAVIDNVQALSATIPVDDDDKEEVKGSAETSPTVEKSPAPAGGTAGAKSTAEKKEKPTTSEAGDGDGV